MGLVYALAPGSAAADVLASSATTSTSYDVTGSFWQAEQEPTPGTYGATNGRLRTVAAADVPGTGAFKPSGVALRAELRRYESAPGRADGDVTNTGGYLANRAEVYARTPDKMFTKSASEWPDPVGSTRWYRVSVLVPSDFAFSPTGTWLTFTQWKGLRGGAPPVQLEIDENRFALGTRKGTFDLGGVARGTWARFDVAIHYATGSSTGWVEVWKNGVRTVPRTAVATMDVVNGAPDPVYLKQGVYRGKAWTSTSVLWFGSASISYGRQS